MMFAVSGSFAVAHPVDIAWLAEQVEQKHETISAKRAKMIAFSYRLYPVYHHDVEELPPTFRQAGQAYRCVTYVAAGEKRYLASRHGDWSDGSDPIWPVINVWDGTLGYSRDFAPTHGLVRPVSDNPRAGLTFDCGPSPFDLAGLPVRGNKGSPSMSPPLAAMLRASNARLSDKVVQIDDSRCVVLETMAGEAVAWLDIDRGYVVKQSVDSTGRSGVTEKRLYNETFTEFEPGIWIPVKARIQWFGPVWGAAEESSTEVVLLAEDVYEYSDMALDEATAPDQFGPPWPRGTLVADFRLGDPVEPAAWEGPGRDLTLEDIGPREKDLKLGAR
jgi:hypothetical protein